MPQIWPMDWMSLFVFFLICLLLIITTMHFMALASSSQTPKKLISQPKINWKW